jgi:hypothetical protein
MKMEQTECSETSAYKIQTAGNYQEEKHTTLLVSLLLLDVPAALSLTLQQFS